MKGYKIWLARVEVSLAVLAGILGTITLFSHDWIEAVTGWSPDHQSGSLEIGLVLVLLVTSVSCAALAHRTYRRLATRAG